MITNADMAALAVIHAARPGNGPTDSVLAMLADAGLVEERNGRLILTGDGVRRLDAWGQQVTEVQPPKDGRQQRVLDGLAACEARGLSPTYANLMAVTGLRSRSDVHGAIGLLTLRGVVARIPYRAAGLAITAGGRAYVSPSIGNPGAQA